MICDENYKRGRKTMKNLKLIIAIAVIVAVVANVLFRVTGIV